MVRFTPKPIINLGQDRKICAGEELWLDASYQGAEYLWQDGSTASEFLAKEAGEYWVQLTFNGCIYSGTLNISYTGFPPIDLGEDQQLCNGDSILLKIDIPDDIIWQDESRNQFFKVKKAGTYWVEVSLHSIVQPFWHEAATTY